MSGKTIPQHWLILTSVVWCGMLLLVSLYYPGAGTAPDIAVRSAAIRSSSAPPVDRSGSETAISSQIAFERLGEGAQPKVFWQVPKPGHVKIVIELPPDGDNTIKLVEDDNST
jgi:hypothetical protein